MTFVPLDRQFIPWGAKEPPDADPSVFMGRLGGALHWPQLLEKQRVVITDWEFSADLARFAAALPVPTPRPPPVSPRAPQEALVRVLRNERPRTTEAAAELPLVVLMARLDADRIREFAYASGIARVEDFMTAVDREDLWSLAARPLDLIWLVDYWRANGRFGRFAEMLEASLTERLKETNLQHARHDPISTTRAMQALERIGATLDFGRSDKITIPDSDISSRSSSNDFDLGGIRSERRSCFFRRQNGHRG